MLTYNCTTRSTCVIKFTDDTTVFADDIKNGGGSGSIDETGKLQKGFDRLGEQAEWLVRHSTRHGWKACSGWPDLDSNSGTFALESGADLTAPPARGAIAANPLTGRVIGGHEAVPHSWPWQVSLQFAYDFDPNYFQHMCGGTIIAGSWVMTAAHCILSYPGRYAVVLGEHDLQQKGNEYLRHVDLIIRHERWNPMSLTNGYDIALLHLEQPAYSTPDVEIAHLPAAGDIVPDGYPCYITGWGLTRPYGDISSKLQEALLPVVSYDKCSSPYSWSTAVTKDMICAGGDGYTAGCQGDSGGPLNCANEAGIWVVQGIVSFGPVSCIEERYPTVFTRVSSFTEWIFKIVQQYGGR
ncbi:chymotrypsin-like elastase family member 2A [Mobula hypostoma]|uniref:chymotrypsin-like elastase family member 2A n=1 Tax=Mobula hypostoma TaxID=723540 RepID=UPI002FC353FD